MVLTTSVKIGENFKILYINIILDAFFTVWIENWKTLLNFCLSS
jgi:hypothetical protein